MKAFEVIRNNDAMDFGHGARKFFSTYENVVNYIFRQNRKYFFRTTDIEETPDELKNKISDRSWQTVRSEHISDPDSLVDFLGLQIEPEYFHILEIEID